MPTDADLLADLLDGRLDVAEAPAELAGLVDLVGAVRTHTRLVAPTPAFRDALREQLVEAVGTATSPADGAVGGEQGAPTATSAGPTSGVGPGGASSGGLTVGGTAAGGAGGISQVVAGVAAAAVLAAGGVAVRAPDARPGDALYDVKRAIEDVQVALAADARDVDLLAGFAVERLHEALDVGDEAVVAGLVGESRELMDEAVDLALAQGRDVDELLTEYLAALRTLSSRSDLPLVDAQVQDLLDRLGRPSSPLVPDTGDGQGTDDPDAEVDPTPAPTASASPTPAPPAPSPTPAVPTVPTPTTPPLPGLPSPSPLPVEPPDVPLPTNPLDDTLDGVGDLLEDA